MHFECQQSKRSHICRLLFNPKALMRTGEVLYSEEELLEFEDHDMSLAKDIFKRLIVLNIHEGYSAHFIYQLLIKNSFT